MKTLPIAVEQRHAQRSFELLDPRCDARRHPMQLTRGFDDATFIDDAFEYLKIDKVHRSNSSIIENDMVLVIRHRRSIGPPPFCDS